MMQNSLTTKIEWDQMAYFKEKIKILPVKSEEEIDYEKTEASCIVECHDVAVLCAGDGFPY